MKIKDKYKGMIIFFLALIVVLFLVVIQDIVSQFKEKDRNMGFGFDENLYITNTSFDTSYNDCLLSSGEKYVIDENLNIRKAYGCELICENERKDSSTCLTKDDEWRYQLAFNLSYMMIKDCVTELGTCCYNMSEQEVNDVMGFKG